MYRTHHLRITRAMAVTLERLIFNNMLWSLLMRLYLKGKEFSACGLAFDKRTDANFILSIFHQLNLNKQY